MRNVVKCLNCGIKWERVTAQYDGETMELAENLMHNCPNCNSNWYEVVVVKSSVEVSDDLPNL